VFSVGTWVVGLCASLLHGQAPPPLLQGQ